jgi:hypothetical protein
MEMKTAEEARQKRIHEAELKLAKLNQVDECARMREELARRKVEEEKRRQEEEARRQEEERKRKIEELRQKAKDEQASLQKVKETTKLCPGCQWPIEKNQGCEHMTCEFTISFQLHWHRD